MSDYGYFEGEVVTIWLKNKGKDRDMKLTKTFTYVDQNNKQWMANEGDVVNGASIPPFLWGSILGSPFVGDYRRATVLHDVACDERTEPSSAVHKMFYHAMLCDGVRKGKAFKMYKAVDLFGPDWGPEGVVKETLKIPSTEDLDLFEKAVETSLTELGGDASLKDLNAKFEQLFEEN